MLGGMAKDGADGAIGEELTSHLERIKWSGTIDVDFDISFFVDRLNVFVRLA